MCSSDLSRRFVVGVGHLEHLVLERQQRTRVDLERQMQVDRAVAGFLRVEIDLPQLPQRVGLDEVPFVVHMETVIDRVALQIGHETGDIDDGHEGAGYRAAR